MNYLCGICFRSNQTLPKTSQCPFAIDGSQWRSHRVTVEKAFPGDKIRLADSKGFFSAPCQKIYHFWEIIRNTWNTIIHRSNLEQARVTHTRNLPREQVAKGQFKEIVDYPSLVINTFSIADPSINNAIVMEHRNNEQGLFSGGIGVEVVAGATGKNNVFTCPATQHKKLREFLDPFFEYSSVKDHIDKFENQAYEYIKKWAKQMPKPVNVSKETHQFGLESIAKCFLGFTESTESIQKAFDTFRQFGVMKAMIKCKFINRIINLICRCDKKLEESAKVIDASVQKVIANCREESKKNLLHAMQNAKDAKGDPLFTQEEIRDTVKILVFAGQETVASLLTYLIYQLGLHPEWREKIREEMQQLSDKPFSFQVQNCKALNNVFFEGLRLNPPAPIIGRTAATDLVVKCQDKNHEFFVEKGKTLVCDNYFSNRDARRWGANAESFDPSRHELTGVDLGPRLNFGEGPNRCLGRHFATLEVKVFLALLVEQLDWSPDTKCVRQVEELATQIEAVPQEGMLRWLWHKLTFNSPSKDIFVKFTSRDSVV